MTISAVCWEYFVPGNETRLFVTHTQDMDPTVTPPLWVFNVVTDSGTKTVIDAEWIGNHILKVVASDVLGPSPPPKPTIELTIFNVDYRDQFGLAEPPYGPIHADPC